MLSVDPDGQPMEKAERFFTWLNRMQGTADFRNPATRPGLTRALEEIMHAMLDDIALRRTCFEIAEDSLTDCDDRRSTSLNAMNEALMVSRALRPGITAQMLVATGRDMYVNMLIEREARKCIHRLLATPGVARPEEIEIQLAFQTQLREPLALVGIHVPMPAQAMLYRDVARVSDEELRQAAREIANTYGDGQSLARWLSNDWTPMARFVEREYADQFADIDASFGDELSRLTGLQSAEGAEDVEEFAPADEDLDPELSHLLGLQSAEQAGGAETPAGEHAHALMNEQQIQEQIDILQERWRVAKADLRVRLALSILGDQPR
jgi:hypothetical protein